MYVIYAYIHIYGFYGWSQPYIWHQSTCARKRSAPVGIPVPTRLGESTPLSPHPRPHTFRGVHTPVPTHLAMHGACPSVRTSKQPWAYDPERV
eukprot:63692-Chlamydomonas_euryale.AAC.1